MNDGLYHFGSLVPVLGFIIVHNKKEQGETGPHCLVWTRAFVFEKYFVQIMSCLQKSHIEIKLENPEQMENWKIQQVEIKQHTQIMKKSKNKA